MKRPHAAIKKIRKHLNRQIPWSPERIATVYENHNARCKELGTAMPAKGQTCPYTGGYPV